MVKHEIFLGHEISKKGIEVDRAKTEVITKLSMPKCVKVLDPSSDTLVFTKDLSRILARLLGP